MKTKSKSVLKSEALSSCSTDTSRKKIHLVKKDTMSWTAAGHRYRWDVESSVTPDLLLDTGATFLESDTEDEASASPPVQRNRPRLLKSQVEKRVNGNPVKARDFQFVAQDYVLFGRQRTVTYDHFEKLSDEIILHIFKMLSKAQLARCMSTCKRWRRLACDESLWKQIDLSQQSLTGDVLRRVLDRGVLALRLSLCPIRGQILEDELHIESKISPCRLQYLDLSMANTSHDILAEILSLCKRLHKLSLEHCELSDLVCRNIADNHDLEVLNMCMCTGVSPAGVAAITSSCQKLHSWNLAWSHLSLATINHICSNMPTSLRRLNISGCKETLSEEHLENLAHSCPFLLELDISNSQNLSSGAIVIIVTGFPSLQHLHASHCYSIAPAQFVSLTKLRHLRHLEVFGILTDCALSALRETLPGVEVNRHLFSTIARPTTGSRRSSIWGISLH